MNDESNEPKDPTCTRASSPPKRGADTVWGERGITKKGWMALPHLLTRNLGALGMQPQEFALVMALMSHKGEQEPWLANRTLARYLGIKSVRGVQKLIARCDGRWFRRISRRTEDGRDLSNKFDLTPLFDRLEALAAGRVVSPAPAATKPMAGSDRSENEKQAHLRVVDPAEPAQTTPARSMRAR